MLLDWDVLGLLGLVAFCAGLMDAIAGGGGLVTLPVLLLAGLEPVSAIATNKCQAAAATASAAVTFARKGLFDWRQGWRIALCSFFGGVLGALFVSWVNQTVLSGLVPVLLIMVAAYFALSPKLDESERKGLISIGVFTAVVVPLLGFYDGVFGPGVGSFFMMSFVGLAGFGFMRALGLTKLANASCNLGSLSVFMIKGAIVWPVALTMALLAFVGAQVGARCVVKVGPRLVKPLLVVVCCALAIKLLSAQNNPLRQWLTVWLNG